MQAKVGIGLQGHFSFGDGLDNFLKFMVLNGDPPVGEFGEIQMALAVFDVVIEPPAYGLDGSIPGIMGSIAVAIIAGDLEDSVYFSRNRIMRRERMRRIAAFIMGGLEKLDQQQQGQEPQQNFLEHGIALNRSQTLFSP